MTGGKTDDPGVEKNEPLPVLSGHLAGVAVSGCTNPACPLWNLQKWRLAGGKLQPAACFCVFFHLLAKSYS